MSEAAALKLLIVAGVVFMFVCVLGLAALGVRGIGLSLGALVPLIAAADGIGRVVMHYGESSEGRKR